MNCMKQKTIEYTTVEQEKKELDKGPKYRGI